jgi:hypothetical protein
MAALRGEATFEAGGKTYKLVYDFNAFCEAEEMWGSDVDDLLESLNRGRGLRAIRVMVWAGLQREHQCHLVETGEIIAAAGAKVAGDAMRKALRGALGAAKEEGEPNPPQAADGTSSAG